MNPLRKRSRKMDKKGQVTIFIVIGILIVVIAGAVLFVNRERFAAAGLKGVQADPIRDYIEECAEEVLEGSLVLLRQNAGHYTRQGAGNVYGISYLNPPIIFNTNEKLERQISDDVKLILETTCNLDSFRDQFDMQVGELGVETEVNLHSVSVVISYPITVIKGENSLLLDDFFVGKDDEFGIMNKVAEKIREDEIYGDGFDIMNWKENSIFKEEEVNVDRENVAEGTVFSITTPYDPGRYMFILGR